ncbi:hypothetical protein CCUN_1818 [Campylobacter cuniculorum DSM 23162 = LMG 24588]|uniref:Uncharacterized protein n=2 Tax=Campylobacter cuniculorum TaxID=374106 RepID=A0A1W6BZA6_9BACT|nr:hypothetical protein CCUN_1818 [Campylobacter cuniculorum DSM 23162 = LMG 24588]
MNLNLGVPCKKKLYKIYLSKKNKMAYVDIPREISSKEILENGCNLSSNAYKKLLMKNKNFKTLGELLIRNLERSDLGIEVGSLSYVPNSAFKFMRAKALQRYSFLPEITDESLLCILPQSFVNMDLKEGDVIISKDSNIGEVIILEKDYPNTMLSGAMYKLPLAHHKYYILAMIKHRIFREQLDFIVPKGATIRHARQLFLECKIPFPNFNAKQSIEFIETLAKSIIYKEKLIKERHTKILKLIESELLENQKPNVFKYAYPTFAELQESGRLDTGIYCEEFKKIDFLIKNYNRGIFYINENNIKSGATPTRRFIGKEYFLPYQWITPSHCSDYGTIKERERINFLGNPNITQDCILLINRGQGKDCGKSIFYSFKDLRMGQHNQGMYRIIKYPKTQMLFILCFLMQNFMRRYCSFLSLGSKMKELKIEHFLRIPFPNFPKNLQE